MASGQWPVASGQWRGGRARGHWSEVRDQGEESRLGLRTPHYSLATNHYTMFWHGSEPEGAPAAGCSFGPGHFLRAGFSRRGGSKYDGNCSPPPKECVLSWRYHAGTNGKQLGDSQSGCHQPGGLACAAEPGGVEDGAGLEVQSRNPRWPPNGRRRRDSATLIAWRDAGHRTRRSPPTGPDAEDVLDSLVRQFTDGFGLCDGNT